MVANAIDTDKIGTAIGPIFSYTSMFNKTCDSFHSPECVRFDTKGKGDSLGEGGERYYNYIRLVRNTN